MENTKIINFLLGSGIHGNLMPNVRQLTNSLLNSHPYSGLLENPEEIKIHNYFKRFINILYNNASIYFKKSSIYFETEIEPNYEHIYYLLNQLKEDQLGIKYNPVIDNFRKEIFMEYGFSTNDVESDDYYLKASRILDICDNEFKKIILKELENKYKPNDYEKFRLIKDSINSFYKINIFSLNHDTIFEDYFRFLNTGYNDGFVEEVQNDGWNKGYKWNRNAFNQNNNNKIDFLKLHGSIDWGKKNEDYIYRIKDINLMNPQDNQITIGIYNKLEVYLKGIYIDIFNIFWEKLRTCSTLVISGYGFRDEGINNYLEYWINLKTENRFIIIDPNIGSEDFGGYFLRRISKGKVKPFPKSFCDIDLSDLDLHD